MACAAARSPADQDRFICIYPAYLNNKKTIAEGRRIPISKAVENPTATEIQDVCSAVGLNVFLEKNKMYSREWNRDVQYRGRVRVQLKQEDGSLCLVQFPSLTPSCCPVKVPASPLPSAMFVSFLRPPQQCGTVKNV
ncbi:signal recognition particle 19 kDa protein isoform X4 [Trachypithecus francoisi]|uniref:signal recognition particle 19 kDa protein isoform X4 n=1 Tax=Trachypithecus francoisi TaxID=54180 RepID=UPI00141B39A4|nr:signal recognition particle 19 kDa protein isoform X4 [Trachypithecus francoisi]